MAPSRSMLRCALVLFPLLAFACGNASGDAGQTGSTGSDGGAGAPTDAGRQDAEVGASGASGKAGDAAPDARFDATVEQYCAHPGLTCAQLGSSMAPACECLAHPPGTWQCDEGFLAATLPYALPNDGDPCDAGAAITCWGLSDCAPICHCDSASGTWSCASDACIPPACPTESMGGERCDPALLGQRCHYDGFCAPTCYCGRADVGDDPIWHCLTPPC